MLRFEKGLLSLLTILSAAFLARGNSSFLLLSTWLLAGTYGIGAYWLFRPRELAPAAWVRIVVGLSLALSLLEVLNSIRIRHGNLERATTAQLGVACIALSTYWWLHRRQPDRWLVYRPLLIRSAVVFTFCAFFAYCPVTSSLGRTVLLTLNSDKPELVENLRMFDCGQRADEAITEKNYGAAIVFARQAVANGCQWLGADSITERFRINGAYSTLYKAYRCQGNDFYERDQFDAALRSYQTGHRFLMKGDYATQVTTNRSSPWEIAEEAWSLDNQAYCYFKLHRLPQSDSLFLRALAIYQKSHPIPDTLTAIFLRDAAHSLAAGKQWASSTYLYKCANQVLLHQPTPTAKATIAANSLALAINYVNQDSLPQALQHLRTVRFPASNEVDRYEALMYTGICFYKQSLYVQADSQLRCSQQYYHTHPDLWLLEVGCTLLLAKNCLARALYSQANSLAMSAQALAGSHKSAKIDLTARCVEVLAAVNQAQGRYDIATKQFTAVLATYQQEGQGNDVPIAGVRAQLASLEIIKGNEESAQMHIRAAIALVAEHGKLKYASQTELLNTAAYVNYTVGRFRIARTQYQQSLAINRRFGRVRSVATVSAWNGQALVEMEQNNLIRADSLFAAAMTLSKSLLSNQNPITADVCLNYALLRVQQMRLAEASVLLQKARRIAEAALPADHDLFGDLAAAQGDIAKRQGLKVAAHIYYQQALAIYSRKFPASHWKRKKVSRKLSD